MRSRSPQRVVITGLGIRTALGPDLESCWRRLIAGESGIRTITRYNASEYVTKVAAEADGIPRETGDDRFPWNCSRRSARLFLPAAEEAWRAARLAERPITPEQIGISSALSVNYIDMRHMGACFDRRVAGTHTVDMERVMADRCIPRESFYRRQGDMAVAVPARRFGIRGPMLLSDTACSASAHAIGSAWQLIRHGQARAMLAGGSAALVAPLSVLAFALLGALSKGAGSDASRPFDKKRDGFVMGEAGAAVLLESLESALERGAPIVAELVGFGSTTSGHNLTDPSPNGVWEARAMTLALQDAGLRPEEIDYVAAHGTSTPKNDINETVAIKSAFGGHARNLLVSSNKGHIGHTISAAGACNVVFTAKALQEGIAPPTANLRNPDPDCDLDYVPLFGRPASLRAAVCNAFAFGGQNVSLALKAWN